MNDVTEIAKLLVGLISPALPFLIKIGEKVSESVASDAVKALGKASWEKAQRIWAKLSPQAQKKGSAQQALKKVIQRPDEFSQGALIGEIRDILEENPELAQELLKLLQEKDSESHSVDDRSINIQSGGVSIRGSSTVGGNIIGGNQINLGK